MSVLSKALSLTVGSSEKRSSAGSYSYFNDIFSIFSGGAISDGKISAINYKQSLKLSAVFNSVDQISSDVAKIPFGVYQKNGETRVRVFDHPADVLLSREPNMYMTSFVERKMIVINMLLRGNAIEIPIYNSAGIPVSFKFVAWDDVVDIRKKNDDLLYYIRGYEKPFLSSEVLHFKMFTHNGIVGVGAITYAAQQLNIAVEIQNFSATNFESKGIRNGVISTDKALGSKDMSSASVKSQIREGWRNAMAERSPDRVVVLDEGMTFQPINITPQEAQIVEMSRFSIEDVARWFNMPLHKIKSLAQSTNNNIEQQSLDYASDTIHPIVTNLEQEYAKKLFTQLEKASGYYVKGNMNVLYRADLKTRAEYYSKAVNFGWENRNEIRAKEDMNPGPELLDEYLTPVNTYTEKQVEKNLKNQQNGN